MKKTYVIGLSSGTSFDGIDVALVRFLRDLKPKFIDGIVCEYPRIVKERIRTLINPVETCQGPSIQEISQLNFLLGEIFAEAANKIIKKNKLTKEDILLISSHGQTIYHHPRVEKISGYKVRSTLQIGEGSVIAARTGIKTVSNFREADIAAGGQGAPLVPFLDSVLFGNSKNIKAILNIGGISNITIIGKNIRPIAFDIGPGNALIDLVSQKNFNKEFDQDGKLAQGGEIDYKAIERTLKDPYFRTSPPKTTGKEYFNLQFIEKNFSKIKNKKDKIATITYLSAKIIEKAFNDFIFPKYTVKEMVIAGGGVKNKSLINYLKVLLPNLQFNISDHYGLPYKYKEAILFALLGYTCFKGIPNNIPFCTGAKKKAILGKITFV